MATATVTERRPLMDLPIVAEYLGVEERARTAIDRAMTDGQDRAGHDAR